MSDQLIASLEAQLSRLYAERAAIPHHSKHSKATSTCVFPPSYNFTHWAGSDVKLPVPLCPAQSAHPPAESLAQLASQGVVGPVPVVPSLLVPCCAHSGTTFLWRCMAYAFHPQRVCGRVSSSRHNPLYASTHQEWTATACPGRNYLLPGLTGNIEGHWDYRKEWFFYGGGAASWAKGWQDYTGVPLSLCYWEPEFQRQLREQPLDDTLAHARRLCRASLAPARASTLAVSSGPMVTAAEAALLGHPSAGEAVTGSCTHRACIPLDLHKVRLSPAYAGEYDKATKPRWQMQATKSLPRVHPASHVGAVVSDMTPNYLCSPKALRNLAGSIGTPAHFRLLLLVRRPLDMLAASYKMFVRWGWVRAAGLASGVRPAHALPTRLVPATHLPVRPHTFTFTGALGQSGARRAHAARRAAPV